LTTANFKKSFRPSTDIKGVKMLMKKLLYIQTLVFYQ